MFDLKPISSRVARVAGAAAVAGLLCLASPHVALADQSLESLEQAAIQAADSYQAATEKVSQIQGQIEDNAAHKAELEAELPAQRERAASAIRAHYRLQQDQANLVSMLLSAEDFNQFLSQAQYLTAITTSKLNEMVQLTQMEQDLDRTSQALESAKAAAEVQASEAQGAYERAEAAKQAAIQAATANAAAQQAAYEQQLAAGTPDQSTNQAIEAATAKQGADAADASAPKGGQGQDETTPTAKAEEPQREATPAQPAKPSYNYVGASTYGEGDGLMYSATASGDVVTPTSMGVAMKSVPLGTVVEVSYGGNTVTAVVNDRGPFVAGREIDLQPAVAHALGFDGVGTVGYRIVG